MQGAPAYEEGFVDGDWQGEFAWDAAVDFDIGRGAGDSSGSFFATFQGGLPTGTFEYSVPDATGTTEDARAELLIQSSGDVVGDAAAPLLLPQSLSISGEVEVFGVDTFPVELTLGADELEPIPLDVGRTGCSFVSGSFESRTAQVSADVAGAGGSLSVHRASWAARRTGDGGTSTPDQNTLMVELLKDGVALKQAISSGSFDSDALAYLVYRAGRLADAVQRNTACQIATPGTFTTAVADIVTGILTAMVQREDLFSVYDFWSAVVAGVQSGAIGWSAGPADDQLVADIGNVLRDRFSAAAAAGNRDDLAAIATVGNLMGDDELVDLAVGELKQP